MGNEFFHGQRPAEDQIRRFFLQIHGSAVASEQTALTHTNRCAGNLHALGYGGLRKQENTGPWTGEANGLLHDSGHGSRYDHEIRAALIRQPADLRFDIRIQRIVRLERAAPEGKLAAGSDGIGGYNFRPGAPQQHGKHQANRSLANHHGGFIGLGRALHYGLQTGVDRFDETGALERNSFRNFFNAVLDDPVHNAHVLREAAAGRFKSRCHTHLLIDRALGIKLSLAVEAVLARNMVKNHYAIAGNVLRDIASRAHYHSGGLMSIDAGRGQKVVFDFLQVGMADSTRFHAHQDFARSDLRYGHLLDAYDTLAFVHSRVHRRRNTPVRIGNRQ